MELIKTTPADWPGRSRYFIDGKPVTQRRYEEARDIAKIRDCFKTETISVAGGFKAFRYRQSVR